VGDSLDEGRVSLERVGVSLDGWGAHLELVGTNRPNETVSLGRLGA
jgi:hypothetical protein